MKGKNVTQLYGLITAKGYTGLFHCELSKSHLLDAVLHSFAASDQLQCQVCNIPHVNYGDGTYVECRFNLSKIKGDELTISAMEIYHRKWDGDGLIACRSFPTPRATDILSDKRAVATISYRKEKVRKIRQRM